MCRQLLLLQDKAATSSEIKRQIRRSKQTRIKLAWEFKVPRSLALKKYLPVRVVLYDVPQDLILLHRRGMECISPNKSGCMKGFLEALRYPDMHLPGSMFVHDGAKLWQTSCKSVETQPPSSSSQEGHTRCPPKHATEIFHVRNLILRVEHDLDGICKGPKKSSASPRPNGNAFEIRDTAKNVS